MVSSISYNPIYDQYANYQNMWPEMTEAGAPIPGSPAALEGKTDLDPLAELSEEEKAMLFDGMFEAALNEYFINQNAQFTTIDPELAKVRQQFKDNGTQFSFDQHQHSMPQFNEFAEVVEPKEKYFFPASMANDHALLEMALIDCFKVALGATVQNTRPIDLPAWQEACVTEALAKSSDIIDTTPQKFDRAEHYRPIDKDISLTMDVKGTQGGSFTLRTAMTSKAAPKPSDFTSKRAPNATSAFAAFSQAKPDMEIEIKRPKNNVEAFAAASSGQSSQVQVKIHYKGPKIAYNTAHNASGRFATFLADCATGGIPTDVNALILWVLRESYKEGMNILLDVRERVKFFNKLKDEIRTALKELNEIKAQFTKPAAEKVATARNEYIEKNKKSDSDDDKRAAGADFDLNEAESVRGQYDISEAGVYHYFYNNSYTGVPCTFEKMTDDKNKITTLSGLENYIKEMESKLATVGDDAQTQNINLQSAMQKQTQLIQTISNLQKLLADTAMAVIRNIS